MLDRQMIGVKVLNTARILAKFVLILAGLTVFLAAVNEQIGIVGVSRRIETQVNQISISVVLLVLLIVLPLLRKFDRTDLKSETQTGNTARRSSKEAYIGSLKYGLSMLLMAVFLAAACIPLRADFQKLFVQITDLAITVLFAIGILYLTTGVYGLLSGRDSIRQKTQRKNSD